MKLGGLEKFSGVDYDGLLACTVFTVGCNFRCPFCHNSPLVIQNDEGISEEDFFKFLRDRQGVLQGVCVSGGEPTLQKDLIDFITKIKQLNYKIKLDTNGTNPAVLKELVDKNLIDYVAMDIKNSYTNYGKIIGLGKYDLSAVKQSVEFLLLNKIDYEFRTTLVREFITLEDVIEMGTMVQGAKKLFLQKFKPAETCLQKNLTEVKDDDAKLYKEILSDYVEKVNLRGY